ncbi:MAG: glycosyltransferase [Saprospiraceae bacterium]|nr:glycosyltransferase [Saprospiraceae bacterium]
MWLIFLTISGIQVVFWMLFYFAFRKISSTNIRKNKELPPVSVVIVFKNSKSTLNQTVKRVLEQSYPTFEVILMDDFSTDGSVSTIENIKNEKIKIFKASQDQPGKKSALSEAIGLANYPIVFLTDADCLPASDQWIHHMASTLCSDDKTEIVLGYSPMTKTPGLLNAFSRYETLLTAVQYFAYAFYKIPYMGVGRNLMYRKDVFIKHKGFDKHASLPGGDDDLFIQSAATLENVNYCLHPASFVFTEAKTTLHDYCLQKLRHITTSVRYRWYHKLLLSVFGMSQLAWLPISIILILFSPSYAVYLCFVLLVKWILLLVLSKKTTEILDGKDLHFKWPLWDTLMSIYLICLTIRAPFYRKRW